MTSTFLREKTSAKDLCLRLKEDEVASAKPLRRKRISVFRRLSAVAQKGVLALMLVGAMSASATRYFIRDGGDVSVANNFSGGGNVYFQGGYQGASSAYLPEGKTFTSTVIVYVFNDFTLNIQGGVFEALLDETTSASNPSFTVGKGVVNQSGGTVNIGMASPAAATRTLCLAYSNNGHAQYNLSGGTLNVRGDSLLMVRNNQPATFTQTGGVLDLSGGRGQAVLLGETGSGTATVNLRGGVAKVGRFYSNIATASYLNFDGGTVQTLAASAEFIGSATDSKGLKARVLAGGAIFDVWHDVTSCLPLVSGVTAPALDGGLTKKGDGVFTLASGNTYTGPTKIEAGALKIAKGTTFSGSLEIDNDGQLLISGVTDADVGQVVATFAGGITLGEGVSAASAFASDTDMFRLFEISPDGKSVIARGVTAVSLTTLTTDWNRPYADYELPDGDIDLNGHRLAVRFTAAFATSGRTITDSSAPGAGGTLTILVPGGMTVENSSMPFTGSLTLCKAGGGTYLSSRANQSYTGGTVVKGGNWNVKLADSTSFGGIASGADKRIVRIETNGTLDFVGTTYGFSTELFVLAGGSLVNGGADIGVDGKGIGDPGGRSLLVNVKLEADSRIAGNTMPFLASSYVKTYLDMGGHKLTVAMNPDKRFYLCNTSVTGGGVIEVTGGYLVIGGYSSGGDPKGSAISMPTTSLVQSGTGGVRLLYGLEVLDYTCKTVTQWMPLTGTLTVNGALRLFTDKYLAPILKADGSIDVSTATEPFPMNSTIDNQGMPSLPSTVFVETGTRELKTGDRVLAWNGAAYEGITFTANAALTEQGLGFEVKPDGLYVHSVISPDYAKWDLSLGQWKFFTKNDVLIPDWDQGVTSDIWVRFASDAEYQAIKATGLTGRGLLLSRGALPQNETPTTYDWSEPAFGTDSDCTFDLMGNTLIIPASLLADNSVPRTFTSSVAGGRLKCRVGSGAVVISSSTAIGSGMTLVKEGPGVLVWAHNDVNSFCTVAEGTLKGGINNGLFATLTVERGAIFDFNGSFNHTAMKIVSNGGMLTVDGLAINWNNRTFAELEITEDTTVNASVGGHNNGKECMGWGLGSGGKITLNGKTLLVNIPANGTVFWLFGTTFTDAGTLEMRSGAYLCLHASTIDASQVTLNHTGGCFIHNVEVKVANYYANFAADTSSYGSGSFTVSGVFAPNKDCYMNTKLLNGATLDLSARTSPLSMTGTVSRNTTRHLTFDGGATITVDVHGREFTDEPTQVVAWESAPEGVNFVLDAETRKKCYVKAIDGGLYVTKSGPMVMFVR